MEFFFGKWQKSWKSHGIYSLVPMIFSNRGGQFKGNSSNLREVKLPDLTMGTISVLAVSLVCYIMFEIDFLRGFDPGKVMGNMGKIMEKSWNPPAKSLYEPCDVMKLSDSCICQNNYVILQIEKYIHN